MKTSTPLNTVILFVPQQEVSFKIIIDDSFPDSTFFAFCNVYIFLLSR